MSSNVEPSEPLGNGLPDCEGWVCQSCGADNFIPAGFERVEAAKADAWDEGYRLDWTGGMRHSNPYRAAALDPEEPA